MPLLPDALLTPAILGIFVGTGVLTTLLVQIACYNGMQKIDSLFIPSLTYIGMSSVFLFPERFLLHSYTKDCAGTMSNRWRMFVGLFDVAGCTFCTLGVSLVGSGLFQVIYASVTVWCAVISWFFLKRRLDTIQWASIATVIIGLSISARGSLSASNNGSYLLGVAYSLLGAFFYAGSYVSSEYVLKLTNNPSPRHICIQVGTFACALFGLYFLGYSFPHFSDLVLDPVAQVNGSLSIVFVVFCFIAFSQCLHTLTHFLMVDLCGSVTTGLLSSIRAVLVFLFSSFFFCSSHETQCLTSNKVMSTVVVICGVIGYSYETERQSHAARPAIAESESLLPFSSPEDKKEDI